MESSFLTRDQALSLWSGSTDSKTLDYHRTNPREYLTNSENSHKGNHLNTRPRIIQPTVAPCEGCKQQTYKQQTKHKPNHQQTESPPHSALPIRGTINKQKLSTNIILHEANTNHWTNLRRAEMKRKKEFNLEAWGKETSNTISF